MIQSSIPVIDLFAGPGGLGEGFSSLNNGKSFHIIVSAEKDPVAHETLLLRAFYRLLKNSNKQGLSDYYAFCKGETLKPYSDQTKDIWEQAKEEALCIELGTEAGNAILDQAIQRRLGDSGILKPWILIGGPPCQAYSLVGRARNKGNAEYSAEADHRNFLYKEYLRIINRYKPAMFVMENVKGMLSAKVNGGKIFNEILQDLASPDRAFPEGTEHPSYRIHSLNAEQSFKAGDDPARVDPNTFIIRAEDYGIPQARHRVILIGIREDFATTNLSLLQKKEQINVEDVIDTLPPLRSRLSKEKDTAANWQNRVGELLKQISQDAVKAKMEDVATELLEASTNVSKHQSFGASQVLRGKKSSTGNNILDNWFEDKNLNVWLNHETRGHRIDDLGRYAFASAFAKIHGRSPKGHIEFNLPGLAPAHKNWKSGKFSDRFRVQTRKGPSTTITSHISKDGHYFIHYDPAQCRSLTVREAARLQTFPDNYFFQGGRTQQYHQVGNAVPPYLAHQIAKIVENFLIK
ncbi:DNA (cytosine-5-)-methyltransferase [Aliiglaciecola litoralis]|uniref:DNA (cytosine-5-)-methyltransferase n=1 Tax=Aliiglaciecola litoralis TaxID=582857 RepID=A0ABN1LHW7_9ALTE